MISLCASILSSCLAVRCFVPAGFLRGGSVLAARRRRVHVMSTPGVEVQLNTASSNTGGNERGSGANMLVNTILSSVSEASMPAICLMKRLMALLRVGAICPAAYCFLPHGVVSMLLSLGLCQLWQCSVCAATVCACRTTRLAVTLLQQLAIHFAVCCCVCWTSDDRTL